jgi:hypothetical protein
MVNSENALMLKVNPGGVRCTHNVAVRCAGRA